ncbi:MAG: hypothetical protein HLUCCA01_06160 [Bacteroidetes bacterium HLUCCA01]|nr:MAG: hypothetical protein HLUCCA01_06160 [Bacteroidetes bacterium HLUCCA01]
MSISFEISEIDVDTASQTLSIVWNDGETSFFPFDGLRKVCPCVFCRGGHEYMGKKMDPAELAKPAQREWRIRSVKPMGNYAIQIVWNDGHDSGLYRFEALRQLWEEFKLLEKT